MGTSRIGGQSTLLRLHWRSGGPPFATTMLSTPTTNDPDRWSYDRCACVINTYKISVAATPRPRPCLQRRIPAGKSPSRCCPAGRTTRRRRSSLRSAGCSRRKRSWCCRRTWPRPAATARLGPDHGEAGHPDARKQSDGCRQANIFRPSQERGPCFSASLLPLSSFGAFQP